MWRAHDPKVGAKRLAAIWADSDLITDAKLIQ
jgi:hypothetical protein